MNELDFEYAVIENTASMDRTQKEIIQLLSTAADAVEFVKPLKETQETWYTIELQY